MANRSSLMRGDVPEPKRRHLMRVNQGVLLRLQIGASKHACEVRTLNLEDRLETSGQGLTDRRACMELAVLGSPPRYRIVSVR